MGFCRISNGAGLWIRWHGNGDACLGDGGWQLGTSSSVGIIFLGRISMRVVAKTVDLASAQAERGNLEVG